MNPRNLPTFPSGAFVIVVAVIVLQAVLLALKVCNLIAYSWWVVTLPLWGGLVAAGGLALGMLAVMGFVLAAMLVESAKK